MIYAGIDAGSRTTKIVLLDNNCRVIASGIADQGLRQNAIASRLLVDVLRKAHCKRKDIANVVATGYGRDSIDIADETITEITCHAKGVLEQTPDVQTVIDIGGQDSKLIRIGPDGKVRDFVMNDRCAAGTGRFLEIVAQRLETSITGLDGLAHKAAKATPISSMCVVFAETEIIGLMAAGEKPASIIAGVMSAIASRILAMAGRNIVDPVVFTGGVALIPQMVKALQKSLGHKVVPARNPQFTGALGAALLAKENAASV